jgi:fructose-1,6-bisphosphatase/inositol monophosphatase family enzyme
VTVAGSASILVPAAPARLPGLEQVAAIVREVAAEEILPRFQALQPDEVREKKPGDFVTVADEAAERALTRRLQDLLPGAAVIGEEAVAADPGVLERVHGEALTWIIDPVDGTYNFAHGHPTFAVILALAHRGRTLAGWIYDPVGGRMAMAEAGQGAWLDGVRQRRAPRPHSQPLGGFVSLRGWRRRLEADDARRIVDRVATLRCAGHEYLQLLTGEADFAVYRRTMPWDHAAGVLLFTESGGEAALMATGTPYGPADLAGELLLAPDRARWTALRERLIDTP